MLNDNLHVLLPPCSTPMHAQYHSLSRQVQQDSSVRNSEAMHAIGRLHFAADVTWVQQSISKTVCG